MADENFRTDDRLRAEAAKLRRMATGYRVAASVERDEMISMRYAEQARECLHQAKIIEAQVAVQAQGAGAG